jgi:hypothetical protein
MDLNNPRDGRTGRQQLARAKEYLVLSALHVYFDEVRPLMRGSEIVERRCIHHEGATGSGQDRGLRIIGAEEKGRPANLVRDRDR